MKIAIVGLGLIGASLGRAIIKYTSHEVYGLDTDESVLKKADGLKAHSRALSADDYKSVDLVLFALNPDVAISEMNRICPLLKDGAAVVGNRGNKSGFFVGKGRLEKKETSLGVNQHTNGWREVGTEHRLGSYGSMKRNETVTFSGKWMEMDGNQCAK